VQALPLELRDRALQAVAGLVAPGGRLIYIGRARDDDAEPGSLPWPISKKELATLNRVGLADVSFEDFMDAEDPPIRRFRAVYTRPAATSRPGATDAH
jgi:hypothetical protein